MKETVESPKSKTNSIHIQIPKTSYISNQTIEGTIQIDIQTSFPGHILMLELLGIEKTSFFTNKIEKQQGIVQKNIGKNEFIKYSEVLYDFAHQKNYDGFKLQSGQWAIPFQISISDKLPSSMNYYISDDQQCSITYKLRAYLIANNNDFKSIKSSQDLFIGKQIQLHNEEIKKTLKIKSSLFCCFGFGSIDLVAKLYQPSFAPNEFIKLYLEGDFSGSRVKIPNIDIELVGNLAMMSDQGVIYQEKIIAAKQIYEMNEKEFKTQINIFIPAHIILTSQNSLIQLKYQLVITPKVEKKWGKSLSPLILDIQINPTSSSFQYIAIPPLSREQHPENWNPLQLEKQQLSDVDIYKIQQIYIKFIESKENEKSELIMLKNQPAKSL